MQRCILECIQNQEGPHTVEAIRWLIYENTSVGAFEVQSNLRKSWANSFKKSVDSLAERNDIIVHERRLESLEECVRHYPGKTHQIEIRELRQRLLPALCRWVNADYGPQKRYGLSENEVHQVGLLRNHGSISELTGSSLFSVEMAARKTESALGSVLRNRALSNLGDTGLSSNHFSISILRQLLLSQGHYAFGVPP